jgi:hypothetical protein
MRRYKLHVTRYALQDKKQSAIALFQFVNLQLETCNLQRSLGSYHG